MGSGQPKNLHAVIQSFHDHVWLSNIGFSFKQPDIQMSTDKLGPFNSVWPSDAFNLPWGNQTLHSWQETVFHDFASVYFGRGICQSPVVILEFQASYLPLGVRESTSEFDSWIQPRWLIAMIECVSPTQSVHLRESIPVCYPAKIAWIHWVWTWIWPLTTLETDSSPIRWILWIPHLKPQHWIPNGWIVFVHMNAFWCTVE